MRVITLNDDEELINYAKPIVAELRAQHGARGCGFQRDTVQGEDFQRGTVVGPLLDGARLLTSRLARTLAPPAGATWKQARLSLRLDHDGPQGAKPKGEVIADILASIRRRRT